MIRNSDRFVLAMDIGGTNTRIGLVDREGVLFMYRRFPTLDWTKTQPLEKLADLIDAYLNENAPDGVAAVSLGFPSAVSKSRRVLISTPSIPALDDTPVIDLLKTRFNYPIYMDRDVVMLFTHATKLLNISENGIVLGFFIGTGIGNVISMDGCVYNGVNGIAGELGHIPLPGKRGNCSCGNQGCAELYAAGRALETIRDRYFPNEAIENLFNHHAKSKPINHYLDILSQVIAIEIIILDPDCVLLGGGVIQMTGFPLETLLGKIKSHLRSSDIAKRILWLTAPDAQRAGVIGAGLYAFKKLSKESNE